MRFDILTLFPEFFSSPLEQSIIGRAIEAGLVEVGVTNIRDFAADRHHTTDDSPYGGGAGMVMKPEPVVAALASLGAGEVRGDGPRPEGFPRVVLTTPQGRPFDQAAAAELATEDRVVILCGRYEGVDERIRAFVDTEISLGDFILTGGEAAALAIVDAVGRLVPGVLGHADSAGDESFTRGLLEYPQYTRPEEFMGMRVPPVLLSGNHGEIRRWRLSESLRRTLERRPDLVEAASLTEEEEELVEEISQEIERARTERDR